MVQKPEAMGDLRGLVRELLREALAGRSIAPAGAAARAEPVRIAGDHDLAAFVARLIQPDTLEAVRSGKLRFTLQAGAALAPGAAPAPSAALDGVVTEQRIVKSGPGDTLALAPGAVLTPLARDKARRLGLKIERRR